MKSYSDALGVLYGLQRHGIKLGLETTAALLARLGHPELRTPALHIGGTNGKGATAAIAAAVLQQAGYRVGLYTSPHLVDFGERILVGGRAITNETVADLVECVQAAQGDDLSPTFFEFTTVMAFVHFAEAQADIGVYEVGMGGRFDATNVLRPLVSAITNVSLDHEAVLGSTVRQIAAEKAGIIKSGVPLVTGRLSGEAAGVIGAAASRQEAPWYRLDEDFGCQGHPLRGFEYHGRGWAIPGLTCPLPGAHQLDNVACALAALELGAAAGFPVPEPAVRSGLQRVVWEGRLECVDHRPTVLLDGAHNPAAAVAIARYLADLRQERPEARIVLVLGMMRDKDRTGFLRRLLPLVDEVVLTQARHHRAATVRELHEALPAWSRPPQEAQSVSEALAVARQLARRQDIILVTGSLLLIGEVKALLRGCELSPLRG
jgi:dihydrofolate synthase/folylpolyglutamate synthase